MPRPRSLSPDRIVELALPVFWHEGYAATSMDRLVAATGASRHAIYTSFGGKAALFLACLDTYRDAVVTPAFGRVEAPGATLAAAAQYFDSLIDLAEQLGLPGPGCLIGNTMTEVAPHDAAVAERTAAHQARLAAGFGHAIRGELGILRRARRVPTAEVDALAALMAVSTQGLWAVSRAVDDAAMLRRVARTLVASVRLQLAG